MSSRPQARNKRQPTVSQSPPRQPDAGRRGTARQPDRRSSSRASWAAGRSSSSRPSSSRSGSLGNLYLLFHFDPYPFIFLNLAFSTQAAYAAPLILLASNRAAVRDRMTLEHAADEADIEEKQNERLLRGNTEILKKVESLEERILELEKNILGALEGRKPAGADATTLGVGRAEVADRRERDPDRRPGGHGGGPPLRLVVRGDGVRPAGFRAAGDRGLAGGRGDGHRGCPRDGRPGRRSRRGADARPGGLAAARSSSGRSAGRSSSSR